MKMVNSFTYFCLVYIIGIHVHTVLSYPFQELPGNISECFLLPPFQTCLGIKDTCPDVPSGYYRIYENSEDSHKVYCNMGTLCGDTKGGWARVAYLDMSSSGAKCPMGLRLYETSGIRACGRYPSGGCQSVVFSSYNIGYSKICGRVIGYQKGSPDGLGHTTHNLNDNYVDGVSITRGNPRKHIWTFMAGLHENDFWRNGEHECPCAPNTPIKPPSFVGNDYFCESGNPQKFVVTKFYKNDPLWDGKQCGLIEKACCNAPGIPWFYKELQHPTTDDIELRICGNQHTNDEDTPLSFYEIYVK